MLAALVACCACAPAAESPPEEKEMPRVLFNEVLHTANVEFCGKGGDDTLIQQSLFSTFHGGNKPRWAPKDENGKYRKVYALFDNFLVVEGAD